MTRLLLHSTDLNLRTFLAVTLGAEFDVVVESDPTRVKLLLAQERVDVLILDFDSNQTSLGALLEFISGVREFQTPVVVMSDDDTRATAMELVEHGVYDYFRKPPHLTELKIVVRRAHEHWQLKRELDEIKKRLYDISSCDELVGSSDKMRTVYDLIRRVADLNAYVLITGESGTGKELVARAIHNLGTRADAPFVAVACGAIPETLIEAELFGHEKGAFTGASGSRIGYLEQAQEGTLFLDEIGELSLNTQAKLLRVLQQREFSRLGSNRLIPLKARVLFATHRLLDQMMVEGTFRQDLFFRINVLSINVPPLRDRREDIPLLANHLLEVHSAAYGKPVKEIRPRAMDLLLAYDWPGNVRELENVIQRAVILTETRSIGPETLPEALQPAANEVAATAVDSSFEEQLRSYKVKLASQAVQECNGNKTLAARRLNITRAYLHRLLRHKPEPQPA